VLTDKEALAINQDKLGKQGWRFRAEPEREIWVRELSDGEWAVALLNTDDDAAELTIDFSHGWWFLGAKECAVRDVWDKQDVGTTKQIFKKRLAPHDVAYLRLKPLK
jgi:alpha-galactosidase